MDALDLHFQTSMECGVPCSLVMRLITSASMCVVRASRVHTSVNCEELDSPRVRMRTLPKDPLNSSSPCALKVTGNPLPQRKDDTATVSAPATSHVVGPFSSGDSSDTTGAAWGEVRFHCPMFLFYFFLNCVSTTASPASVSMVARLWFGLEFHFMSVLILLLVGFRIVVRL